MKPIKMLLAVPRADDPTSFYRAFGPLSALRRPFGNQIDFMLPSNYDWPTINMCDIFFIQRPADPQCIGAAEKAKMAGVPLWVDFDDDNLQVPDDNPTSEVFNQWQIKDSIIRCARLADVITVSTEHLRKSYLKYNKNIVVIPNAIDDRYLRTRQQIIPKRPRDKVIAWRGGPGFIENLAPITESIIKIAQDNPNWKFIFMGHKPYPITKKITNYQFIEWIPFIEYLRVSCQIHATAWLHSVAVNDHALSRSHGPWLEASFSGAGMVALDIPELKRPGCLNYDTPQKFEEILRAIIKRDIDIEKNYQESWKCIEDNFLLSKTNLIRKEIVERLLGYSLTLAA